MQVKFKCYSMIWWVWGMNFCSSILMLPHEETAAKNTVAKSRMASCCKIKQNQLGMMVVMQDNHSA
eukprot:4717557-Amphidinium_carterae.1